MSTPVISDDSIFSHVFIGAADVQKSAAFYDATLGLLASRTSVHSVTVGCSSAVKSRLYHCPSWQR